MRTFQIEVGGISHRGAWLPITSNAIMVACAKGRRKVYLEGRPPEKAARDALAAMV